MIVYHGTTGRRAKRICQVGFLPRKPSRRVWFAEGHGYARQRARTQARRAHDRAVILTCEIDLADMRRRYGAKRVFHRNGVIAIDGSVSVSVLRSHPSLDNPSSPRDLALWLNRLLGFKPHAGVSRKHPGLGRLSQWVVNRLAAQPHGKISDAQLVALAKRWLPEYFDGVKVDLERLRAYRAAPPVELRVETPAPPAEQPEDEALALLEDPKPRQRARGLEMLGDIRDPDLFEWCAMYLADESVDVRLAALRTMLKCDSGDECMLEPLTRSDNRRIRAAAIAALAALSPDRAAEWFAYGLRDPASCVRLATAALLEHLDPAEHREVFELALYDPNPQISRRARKLTSGKGFAAWARP